MQSYADRPDLLNAEGNEFYLAEETVVRPSLPIFNPEFSVVKSVLRRASVSGTASKKSCSAFSILFEEVGSAIRTQLHMM